MSYLLFNKKFIWFTSFFISIIVLNLYFYFKNSLIEVTINLITVLKNFSLIFLQLGSFKSNQNFKIRIVHEHEN